MAGVFLRAAYQILEKSGKPLTADKIVRLAIDENLINTVGKTPGHTMRARLSEAIRAEGRASYFQRVGSNRFGLRDWGLTEFHARPFKKEIPEEITVCVHKDVNEIFSKNLFGIENVNNEFFEYIKNPKNLTYIERKEAEGTTEYKQLISYVVLVTEDGDILSYFRGKYSSAHPTLLLGRRSIGFGGHVLQEDAEDLFGSNDAGLIQAAVREVGEELNVDISGQVKPVGIIWDNSSLEGQKHIGVLMKAKIKNTEKLNSSELSINRLESLSGALLWDCFHQMEFWSQLAVKYLVNESRPDNISRIVPAKRPKDTTAIAFVGEIASGKSSICDAIAERLNANVVSASKCLSDIIGFIPKGENDRSHFQKISLEFIKTANGPTLLATEIYKFVSASKKGINIIDGLRQLSTLSELREKMPGLVVVYIDCPRDKAFKNYKQRSPTVDITDFSNVREHEVESEIPLFRYESDAVLHNADDFSKTIEVFEKWLSC